jgi:hypothetical protein
MRCWSRRDCNIGTGGYASYTGTTAIAAPGTVTSITEERWVEGKEGTSDEKMNGVIDSGMLSSVIFFDSVWVTPLGPGAL